MKNKDIPILAFLNLLYLLVACVAAELFTILLIRFAIVFVELDFAAASAVRLCSLFAISTGLFCLLGYKDGYRNACFTPSEAVPAVGLAALAHWLICIPTRFSPWLAGATRHISGFLLLGSAYNSESRIKDIPFWGAVAVGFAMALLWAGLFLLAQYIGFRKRLRDRGVLTGESTQTQN